MITGSTHYDMGGELPPSPRRPGRRRAMKLKRPKDCHGCRALYRNGLSFSCLLCFRLTEMKTDKHSAGIKIWLAIPAEPCYKPRTWREYGEAAGMTGPEGGER